MAFALIHDWLNQLGGAEDVLEALVSLYPEAPLYTSLYDRRRMPPHWQGWTSEPRSLTVCRLPTVNNNFTFHCIRSLLSNLT